MNFKYIFILFLSIITSSYSQSKEFVLNWENNKDISVSGDKMILLHGFQTENFNYDLEKKSVLFAVNLKESYSNLNVSKVFYENISDAQLGAYDTSLIKDEIEFSFKKTNSRGVLGSCLSFNPLVKQQGVYKKVVSILFDIEPNTINSSSSSSSFSIFDSEMVDGLWYKFYIDKTGVFKLDKSFMESLGLDVNNINPKYIRVFGNGGKSIPLLNSEVSKFDVTENAIKFVGDNDGVFNNEDYILFYGEGPLGWDAQNNSFINPYSDKTYYYINVGNSLGKRISSIQEPVSEASVVFNSFSEKKYYELDKNNLVKLGRRWFGDPFNLESSQSFSFNFPNRDVSKPIFVNTAAAAVSSSTSLMQLYLNGVLIPAAELSFSAIDFNVLAREDSFSSFLNNSEKNIVLNFNYINNGNPSANAYLDYASIEVTSFLRPLGEQFSFKNNQASQLSGVGEYLISDASSVTEVWDVSDIYNAKSKVNLGDDTFKFKFSLGSENNYIALVDEDYHFPFKEDVSYVNNTNLKGTIFKNGSGSFEDIDYLIVAPSVFLSQAERLASINRVNNGLRVRVVSLDQIYSEFNTGNQDIGAIRNFVRYVYENGVTDKLKYLCLFGDASFDMKDRTQGNTNFVPSFHSLNSTSTISGFISDDYYGMMDDAEGFMGASDRLDLAVGRILSNDLQQATEMVTKIDDYYKKDSYGRWRNKITFFSDDVDVSSDFQLETKLDLLADQVLEEKPFFNVFKIHSDSYNQQVTAGGDSYPDAKKDLLDVIQLGSLVVNYFGHGGINGLASERIFLKNDALNLNNQFRYNVFVTITCDFTRFDNPLRETGGEYVYWNKKGGAVSLITTTRKIFFSTAISINNELSKYLFNFDDSGYVSTAEALRLAKNNITSNNKRVVFNIGDPALKLSIAKPNIRLTHINDIPIANDEVPALESLGRVSFSGEVLNNEDQIISNYNGKLSTTIYDKKQSKSTLGNDGTTNSSGLLILDYQTSGEVIFRGQASIVNGKFKFDFVVPRDILIPLGEGRVSFYAKRDDVLEDQTGVNTSIVVGGVNENAPEDNLPPKIEAFMNDESFVSGGVTGQSPFLLLNLEDENGISTASGIGHDITAIIDGDETNPQILNDYYETELDDFTKGKVKFQYRDLEPGLHTLLIKAWDVYNNSISTEIQFVVVNENEELIISRVLNYPNPFVSYTEFWFNHNSSSELEVMVQVYTVTGKLIKTLRGNSLSNNNSLDSSLFRGLPWDGKDDFGDKIGKGVYVYKLSVKSINTNKKAVKFEKLVIL
jgi:hypothetical protein